MILLKTRFVQVEYHAEVPCIQNTHLCPVLGKDFRASVDKVLELYQKLKKDHRELFWLADTRKFGVMAADDQEWLLKDWNVRAYKAGVRYVGFIVPENIFGELSIKKYNDNVSQQETFETRIFENANNAREWFKSLAAAQVLK